jgi:hypothetical protein
MGTRCGTIDPGVVLWLARERGLSIGDIERLLYRESGLLGISGLSADMRVMLASDAPAARLAIDCFTYRIAREAGSLASALGERDALRRRLALPNVRVALRGEAFLDVIGIVSSVGFAAEVSQCRELCRLTRDIVQRGDVADMLAQSLRLQCGAREARAAGREEFDVLMEWGELRTVEGTTQLTRAAYLNNLPRVLQLIQLGAPLDLVDKTQGWSALLWASYVGHEHVAKALLDGKYEGRGVTVNLSSKHGLTPIMAASYKGYESVVRLLLSRGAKQELQDLDGYTALHWAVESDRPGVVALLCAAPGAAAALALENSDGHTPLAMAINRGRAACEAVLRAHGAPE